MTARSCRWFIDGDYWRPDGEDWVVFMVEGSNAGAGWTHAFTNPATFLEQAIGFAGDDDFAVQARKTEIARLVADRAVLPIGDIIRSFRLAIEDSTNAIIEYGWTIRAGEPSCDLRVLARNGAYGLGRTIPNAIASQY